MANVLHCVFFLKFCVFCLIFVEFSQSIEINSDRYKYNLESSRNLAHLGNVNFKAIRAKRDTNLPQTTVATNASTPPTTSTVSSKITKTETSTAAAAAAAAAATTTTTDSTHLLGENGHGQRKDYSTINGTNEAPAVSSEPLNASDNKATKINKSLGAVAAPAAAAIPTQITADVTQPGNGDFDIDEPEEAINQTITDHINEAKAGKVDYFQYYNSTTIVDKTKSDEYWSAKKEYTISTILSKSHRRAITVQLKFDFPFYGHIVRNVTVATGGFLYTGEYVHSWLAATQYIAPLMANFDTSISNVSTVKHSDNGTAFTVIWEKVPLQDGGGNPSNKSPLFTFSVTLYNTGDITFAYKNIPIPIEMIKDEKHPVKIGLSDAYIIDKIIYFARRKTIYEYHRVNFNGQDIKNDTLITLTALPTCLEHTNCGECLSAELEAFNCTWCPTMNRCSTGTDRKRQEWIQNGCERSQLRDEKTCPALGTKGNNYASQQQVTATPSTTNQNDEQWSGANGNDANRRNGSKTSSDVKKAALAHIDNKDQAKHSHASFALGILLPIVVVASLVLWVFYAYRNPHTKSGQFLIQYRPSQWTWRRGEARYTAATIHM